MSLYPTRAAAALLSAFGLLALLLASIGIYGVMSYGVSQRTRELGIRVALGARPSDLLRLVVGEGMAFAGAGLVLGLISAGLLTRLLSSLLYGVAPLDVATFVAVSSLLASISLLASYVPARRALRVDPVVALRYE